MEIKKYKLDNGLTIVHVPTETNSVALQVLVNVGSINETKNNNGVSHFIEHLVFKGTKKSSIPGTVSRHRSINPLVT